MDEAFRVAHVYVRENLAGTLRETDAGYAFAYDAGYLADAQTPDVSLTLPKREEPYVSKTLFAFFDGLIPEDIIEAARHDKKMDAGEFRFILLTKIGHAKIVSDVTENEMLEALRFISY